MTGQKENSRKTAVEILNRIDETGAYAEPLLDSVLEGNHLMRTADRRLLTQLVYGTLRMKGRCDWIIDCLYAKSPKKPDRCVQNILRVGLFQLLYMDRIPVYAVIDEAVNIAKEMHRPAAGLVNAVLRKFVKEDTRIVYPDLQTDPVRHLSVMHSHPLWIVEKWIGLIGFDETVQLCKANNETPPLTIRANRLNTNREFLVRRLADEGCEIVRETVLSPDGLILSHVPGSIRNLYCFQEGCFTIQDEASQMISLLVDCRPGERVLDICSGTGVKTTHLAEMMQNAGTVIATDIKEKKLTAMKKLAGRLRITNIETMQADATLPLPENFRASFDRVLVDAPCSGIGTLRRNPEIKWRLIREDLGKYPHLQKSILSNASKCLKKDGILVYSTCTITEEENEGVVRDFLSEYPDFQVERPRDVRLVSCLDSRGAFRTYPHRHGTDGFFAVVLKRR
jgi:16S rRNA (cytosine967-C5)-methyltransferase